MKRYAFLLVILLTFFVLPAAPAAAQDDSDGDGTPNGLDVCPNEGGPAWASGCPDSDSDHTPDVNDACPGVGGPAANLGCPEDQPQFQPTAPPAQPTTAPVRQSPPVQVTPAPTATVTLPLIPSGPRIALPSENACVLTPDGGEPINLRAVPSLQGGVIGSFEPGNRALASLPVVVLEGESWYLTGGGWLAGRTMQGTPLCAELPALTFAESDTTIVNQDNSLSPSIPVGMGDTRPIQLYMMPASASLLTQLAARLQLPAGEGMVGLRFPSLRGPSNEILLGLLTPLNWAIQEDGNKPDLVNSFYVGYPERVAEGFAAVARNTLVVDMAAQQGAPFTLALSGIGRLRLIGDSASTGMRICTGPVTPVVSTETGLMLPEEVCPEGQVMPGIAGIAVDDIGGILLLNAESARRSNLLVYEGRGIELIVQMLPGPNPSGGSTPLLMLNESARGLSIGFHRPTQGMIVTIQ